MTSNPELENSFGRERIMSGMDSNHAINHKDGGLEIDHLHIDFKHKEPNFEFGTAGMVVALLQIYCLEKNKNEIVGLIDDPYYK